ncbi:MAG: hypothetical protein KME12_16400 [Trichocoleus desertorum ATA4-8-CV12]|jgi:hypothetical protein|nr:hypothetical protein [Trichocoleus desertorum ATA4-8-CV12]
MNGPGSTDVMIAKGESRHQQFGADRLSHILGDNSGHSLKKDGREAIAMRVKLKEIAFANGAVMVDLYNISFRVKALVTTQPAKGEAGNCRGELLQGEEMAVERVFTHAGRIWVSGKNSRGERVDVDPKDLLYVEL